MGEFLIKNVLVAKTFDTFRCLARKHFQTTRARTADVLSGS